MVKIEFLNVRVNNNIEISFYPVDLYVECLINISLKIEVKILQYTG